MIELSARYYDGETSEPRDVRLRLDEHGMLHVLGLAAPAVHPLASVAIGPPLGSTTRSIALPGGAKCESDDHAALDELLRCAGKGRGHALIHALESNWRSALAATLLLAFLLLGGFKWGIPLAAERIARSVPQALAYDLGRGTLAVLDQTLFEPSTLAEARKNALLKSFDGMSEAYSELPLELQFRRGAGPNAFALPDGTVIATDELVALAQNDNEVLAVLAHEIGHVRHRHSLRMALESSTVLLLFSTYFGDVTQLTTLSAALPGVYAQASYSREHETEADTFALEYLRKSAIPSRHFAEIMRSLQKYVGPDSKHGLQYLESHPPTSERIRRFEH